MEGEDWQADGGAVLGMYLNGDAIPGTDPTGNRVVDDHFLLWFNAGAEQVSATLPSSEYAAAWDVVIDTGDSVGDDRPHAAGDGRPARRPQRRRAPPAHHPRGGGRPLGRRLDQGAVDQR